MSQHIESHIYRLPGTDRLIAYIPETDDMFWIDTHVAIHLLGHDDLKRICQHVGNNLKFTD